MSRLLRVALASRQIGGDLYAVDDSCTVYLLVDPAARTAVAIDAGSGAWLDQLTSYGVDAVSDVEGLPRLVASGARVWVPENEADLIAHADHHWQGRTVVNNYDLHTDRFSLLASVPIAGVMKDYSNRRIGHLDVLTLPTPGHAPCRFLF